MATTAPSAELRSQAVAASPGRRCSPSRVVVGGVLSVWAVMFWFVELSGRADLFLSPRTSWVIPVGAVALTGAAIGRLASARAPEPEPVSKREAVILALFTLPVAL